MKPSRVLSAAISVAALIAAPVAAQPTVAVAACACCQHDTHAGGPDGHRFCGDDSPCEHSCAGIECSHCAQTDAQARAPLDALQVRFLVLRGELDDHRALSGHFALLAGEFAAGARRQEEFARSFSGNPNRFTAVPAGGGRAKQRAVAQRQAAALVSALAAHHALAAAGLPSQAPAGAVAYWAGAGAPAPTREQVRDVERMARLPREHRDLAEYFTGVAQEQFAAAAAHDAHLAAYRGTRIAQAADHCERLARAARDEASWASGRSLMHEMLAGLPQ